MDMQLAQLIRWICSFQNDFANEKPHLKFQNFLLCNYLCLKICLDLNWNSFVFCKSLPFHLILNSSNFAHFLLEYMFKWKTCYEFFIQCSKFLKLENINMNLLQICTCKTKQKIPNFAFEFEKPFWNIFRPTRYFCFSIFVLYYFTFIVQKPNGLSSFYNFARFCFCKF